MARPSKTYIQLIEEGNSHMTKEELEYRKSQEEALLTKVPLTEFQETKENPKAHEEFLRIRNLLRKIEKNDDLFAGPVNRYAMLNAECLDFLEKRETFYKSIEELENEYKTQDTKEPTIPTLDYLKMRTSLQGQIIALDKQIQNKRKMMLDIEKENLMTVASALRSIPKKPTESKEEDSEEEKLFGGNL